MKKKVVKSLLFNNTSVLLLTRAKQLFHGMEDLPGGKLELDELPIPGLIREIKEETGIEVDQLLHVATHEWQGPDGTEYLECLYYAIVDTRNVILNPEEHSSFRWIKLEQIENSEIHPKIKELILANMNKIKAMLTTTHKKRTAMYKLPSYVGIILKKDNKVLLVKRTNTDWASGYWNFPGGLLEEGETLINAAIREAQEEIAVIFNAKNMRLVQVLHVRKSATNTKDIFGFYFLAETWQGIPINNEPHRHSEIGWFDLNHLPDAITEHARLAIDGIKNNRIYSES